MTPKQGLGNFIDGSFVSGGTISLTSNNPSCNFEPVFLVNTQPSHVDQAVFAAKKAYRTWGYQKEPKRIEALRRLRQAFINNEEKMAAAISLEMGKVIGEAKTEAKSLSARIDLMINHGLKRVKTEELYDMRAKTRYHSHGVLAVIGPYNFPAHLINAHVIPSILVGNTVVIKPSQVCPMTAEVYAQCVEEAQMPPGVINMVHGDGKIGQALCAHQDIDGILFTGSYNTGRALKEMLLDQPQKILALEMGGKNFAVIMDDADMEQAISEVILGAFLTTGQRCTATSRVLVHDAVFDRFCSMLVAVTKILRPTKASQDGMFGPLATRSALDKFMAGLKTAQGEGAQVLVESRQLPDGAFVTPSIYQVSNDHPMGAYLGEELFGPNLCLENFSSLNEAIARIQQSPYGLSNAIFTLDPKNVDRLYHEVKSGVLNINRSTNNAFGQMPFGGVNRSGNFRPAGIDAVRYATFPVAITSLAYGEGPTRIEIEETIKELLPSRPSLSLTRLGHEIEETLELFGIYSDLNYNGRICYSTSSFADLGEGEKNFFDELQGVFDQALDVNDERILIHLSRIDDPELTSKKLLSLLQRYAYGPSVGLKKTKALKINVPMGLRLPRSRAMLDRLYHKNFFPKEKKLSVIDSYRTRGAYLASIDEDPLVIMDAASQIATLGAGFQADVFQDAYDCHGFDLAIKRNWDLSNNNFSEQSIYFRDAKKAQQDFESMLNERSHHRYRSIAYGAGGAEANEIAFDLARQNGPGGKKIIAFEGAFHGRTLMSLHATYNKEKRGPFIFPGYEAVFLPFPEQKDPYRQPEVSVELIKKLSQGIVPDGGYTDPLLTKELLSLNQLYEEARRGDVCAVIIEPMQCEGGDRYASNRFFCNLRALSRALKLPLIFDEVQTGFHLGRTFFWFEQFNLVDQHGAQEYPDCITLAKKAQLGICLSVWPNERNYTPHVLQLKRGLLHAQAMNSARSQELEQKAYHELKRLKDYFPKLVKNVRACGLAFAFDMASKEQAMALIDQRFHHGFMVYIAGEKTLRFRLNLAMSEDNVNRLFEKLFLTLCDIRDGSITTKEQRNPEPGHDRDNRVRDLCFSRLSHENFADFRTAMEQIETKSYEDNRRDSMEDLLRWLKVKDSLGLIMTCELDGEKIVAGYAIGGPLEHCSLDGPVQDFHRDQNDTFYSANLTLDDRVRGLGLGKVLKNQQIKMVADMRDKNGDLRYSFMSGRNRLGYTYAMNQINESLGAYSVSVYDNQYAETGAKAAYYRLMLRRSEHKVLDEPPTKILDCQNSLENPLARVPDSFLVIIKKNQLRGMVGSKLTLSNWATPHTVRYSELLRALMPKHLSHGYFTSGRDEMVDKGIRALRFHRPLAEMVIGFSHQWLGNVTAVSRSLSHDEGQSKPFGFFDWPKVDHPSIAGMDESLEQLRSILKRVESHKVLGIVVELMGERSGLSFEEAFLHELHGIRERYGIPLIFVENTSGLMRSGKELFLSDHLEVKANMVLYYSGGQLGHVLVDEQYFVEKPLTLISTWDGDEISMARSYHYLLEASSGAWQDHINDFDRSLRSLLPRERHSGLGVWHGLTMDDGAQLKRAQSLGAERSIYFGQGFDHRLMICAKPDFSSEQFERVLEAVKEVISLG